MFEREANSSVPVAPMNSQSDTEMIYRFRHFRFTDDDEHKREPERILCESQLWCSHPRAFNDPFDCKPNLVMSNIPIDEAIQRTEAMIRRRGLPADHPHAITARNAAREGKFGSPEMYDALRRGMQAAIERSSVCCFNSEWADPRMWAQYADDHKGYCLAFELDGNWPEDAFPIPVTYSEERPEVDLAVDTMEDRDAAWNYVSGSIFTKSSHWQGEKEVRVFRNEVPSGLFTFPPSALKAVYLGLEIRSENRDRLVAAIAQRDQRIPAYQLFLHESRYEFKQELVN